MDNNREASIENMWKQKVEEQVISVRSKPAILDGCRITFLILLEQKYNGFILAANQVFGVSCVANK